MCDFDGGGGGGGEVKRKKKEVSSLPPSISPDENNRVVWQVRYTCIASFQGLEPRQFPFSTSFIIILQTDIL